MKDTMNRKDGGDYGLQSLSLEEKRKKPSAHQLAVGHMEFNKQFLISSYCGKKKLEDVITVDAIRSLENLPMDLFETELWRLLGCKCIQDTDRAKNLDWNSDSRFMYDCHVDPDGTYQFKGPYLQPGETKLHRDFRDENVLRVKFAKPSGVDGNESNDITVKCNSSTSVFSRIRKESIRSSGSISTYSRIRREGIIMGLRRYEHMVFKDSSKREKKKGNTDSTFSSVKCYFVCMESGVSPLVALPRVLSNKSISEVRSGFMHIRKVPDIAKYMPRLSLILSKTFKFEIDFESVNIEPIEDQLCLDQNGNTVYNEDRKARIHTDGTGFISRDLALKCPRNITKGKYSSQGDYESIILHHVTGESSSALEPLIKSYVGEPPLLIQFRLFHNGSAIKGTLLVNNKLLPNTIQIRPSMVKVESDTKLLKTTETINSFEVVTTSKKPKKAYLSKYLIALLNYGGVPKEYFLGLLTNALEKAKRVTYDKRAALKATLNYGEMDDFLLARMILSGIPLGEPHLQNRLSVLMREEFKSFKEGKIPIDESCYLMGTADPTGILNTDEVCVILENGQISGDVLVYRHPGLHFGDVHVMKAVYVKELEDFIGQSKYGIFFPTKGPRSIADEIANGDFDGDTYWVSRNTMFLSRFKPSKPWVKTYHTAENVHHSKPTQFSPDELEDELFKQFLTASFDSNCKGLAANSWLVLMDRLLVMGDGNTEEKEKLKGKMLHLAEIYYDALDAAKTGKEVYVPDKLRTQKYPHFMRNSESESDHSVYRSTSVLGLIYDTVGSYEERSKLQEIVVRKLPSFDGEIPRSCLLLWKERYDKYRGEMSRAMKEDEDVKGKLADAVIQKYKQMLYNATELNVSTRNKEDIYNEALAIYHICYEYAQGVEHGVGLCSFAWRIAGHALCEFFVRKQRGSHFICSRSVLQEVLSR